MPPPEKLAKPEISVPEMKALPPMPRNTATRIAGLAATASAAPLRPRTGLSEARDACIDQMVPIERITQG